MKNAAFFSKQHEKQEINLKPLGKKEAINIQYS